MSPQRRAGTAGSPSVRYDVSTVYVRCMYDVKGRVRVKVRARARVRVRVRVRMHVRCKYGVRVKDVRAQC